MAVRAIGSNNGVKQRFQPVEGGISTAGNGTEGNDREPAEEQSGANQSDNLEQSVPDGEADFVNPESLDTGSGDDSTTGKPKRGRGRPRGSGSIAGRKPATKSSNSKTTDSVAAMLFTVHRVASSFLNMPILKLEKDACTELSEAIMQVTELYEIPLLSEKGMAWANLASVGAKVYIFDHARRNTENKPVVVPNNNEAIPMPVFMKKGNDGIN